MAPKYENRDAPPATWRSYFSLQPFDERSATPIDVDFAKLGSATAPIEPARRVTIPSEGAKLDAYLWLPKGTNSSSSKKLPVIVWGHGLGAVQYMGLTGIAQFYVSQLQIAVLTFDYRGFGNSTLSPGGIREYIDIEGQKQDWRNVLQYVKGGQLGKEVDSNNVSIGGSSFGGGMVLAIAAEPEQADLKCVVAQVPFVGIAESLTVISPLVQLKMIPLALTDKLVIDWLLRNRLPPIRVPVVAPQGWMALMSTPSSWKGFMGLTSDSVEGLYDFQSFTPARFLLESLFYRPLYHSKNIKASVLAVSATQDDLIPIWAARRALKSIPGVEYHELKTGHFDVYPNCKDWKDCSALHIDFLKRKLDL